MPGKKFRPLVLQTNSIHSTIVRRLGLVLSDLHLGTGHRVGRINVYDDFKEDERLAQLLAKYSGIEDAQVHLILNGDIFDLLKVPIWGTFPDAISERLACIKLHKCLKGHPRVVEALGQFVANGRNLITYQPGNHDMDMFFPAAQALFRRAVAGREDHPQVRFVEAPDSFFTVDGVQFHHGHQFEAIHALDFRRLFLQRPGRDPILNLPWGSLFILHVVNEHIGERPYLDKVHPFWPLFVGGMLVDTAFTAKMVAACAQVFIKARFNPNWWQKRPFEKVSRFLRRDVAFFEHLDRYAQRLLTASRSLTAVFMGHSHVPMVRTFRAHGATKVYVNTGTWIPMVELGLGRLGQRLELHYGLIEWRDDGHRASLHRWHGRQSESEEIIA